MRRFLDAGDKFALIYRYDYELEEVADKFFRDIGGLFFPGKEMVDRKCMKGVYRELYLDGIPCGYALALNKADAVKKMSHMLSDVKRILFDEFQPETGKYLTKEVDKFISIHTSISRGGGKLKRYVPVYMLSNPVTLLNPYYVELGIATRLRSDTKFLRGDGFVLEQGYNETASRAQKESAFNRAFAGNSYMEYNTQGVYLLDNQSFVDKPAGKSRYTCTLRYLGTDYAIREYPEEGIVYVDTNVDATYPLKISVTTNDHKINYLMLERNNAYLKSLRFLFEKGKFRFKNIMCKEAVLKALSYQYL